MMFPMSGVALVTGAASGIGAATARAFVRAGVKRLSIADVQKDKLDALKAEVMRNGTDVNVLPLECNVSDPTAVKSMVKRTVEAFGRIDYAVNCAGVTGGMASTSTTSDAEWNKVVGINQNGVFYCMREELAVMEKQEHLSCEDTRRQQRGSIVNISSVAGILGVGNLPGYVASKHAVVGLTKAAAVEYGAKEVRINCICPGYIDTPMTQDHSVEQGVASIPPVPMPRAGRPEEVADVTVFLAGEGGSFVTGAIWTVDGGYSAL